MNAARAYHLLQDPSFPVPVVAPTPDVPPELSALFEESPHMRASFARLSERDRRGFVSYVEESRSIMTRERRAAIVAMSLMGLARDLTADALTPSSR